MSQQKLASNGASETSSTPMIPDKKLESLAMPAFGQVLEDKQIRELIRFERAFSQGGAQSTEMREIFNDACAQQPRNFA